MNFLPQRWSAWIAAALTALNITFSSTNAPIVNALDWLADPADLVYTYPEQALDEFLDRSRIRMYQNYVQIDGVWYDDVWLSHDAAEKFRVNASDLQTAFNIASNSNGTFASGAGSTHGFDIFETEIDGATRWISQTISFPWQNGDYAFGSDCFFRITGCSSDPTSSTSAKLAFYVNGSSYSNNSIIVQYSDFPARVRLFGSPTSSSWTPYVQAYKTGTSGTTWYNQFQPSALRGVVSDPFSFDWVSGTIPAEELGPEDGLHLLLPHNQQDESPIGQYVIDHPEYLDPSGHEIDISLDPDVDVDLDDLMDIIIPLIPIIKAEWGPIEVSPIPPVDPTSISNTPWTTLQNKLDEIINTISGDLSTISQILGDIGNSISSLPERILEDIQKGPIQIFDKALDFLKLVFAPILALLKNALGIWHYVVEWLQSISSPWAFFWGVLSGLGSSFTAPIYACVAGFIVIAVYRRFGR